jgi:hypothetical protein
MKRRRVQLSKAWRTPALLALFLLPVLSASRAGAQVQRSEAENYVAFDTVNAGGGVISLFPCAGASGGYALDGFDWPGDSIILSIAPPLVGTWSDSLRSAGALKLVRGFHVEFLSAMDDSLASDDLLTGPGLGTG